VIGAGVAGRVRDAGPWTVLPRTGRPEPRQTCTHRAPLWKARHLPTSVRPGAGSTRRGPISAPGKWPV